jgi:hypothetical protein
MPICTTASLNVACFRGYNLTRLQKLAFKIWYATNELAQNGGPNYTTHLSDGVVGGGATNLLNDSVQLFDHWDRDALDAAEVAIYFNNAVNAGAIVSNVPNTVQNSIRRMEQISEDRLRKMLIYLECQLGAHRNPPL